MKDTSTNNIDIDYANTANVNILNIFARDTSFA